MYTRAYRLYREEDPHGAEKAYRRAVELDSHLVFGASRKFEDLKQWLVDITGEGQNTESAADDV